MADLTGPNPDEVNGDVAHNATDIGNPVKIGGYASTAVPTAVTAGNRTNAWFGLHGELVVAIASTATGVLAGVAASADATSAPTGLSVRSRGEVYNGTTWDMMRSVQSVDVAPNVDTGILAVGIGPGFDRKLNPVGTLGTANGSNLPYTVSGADIAMVYISTTTTGTFTFEVSADDANWIAADVIDTQIDRDVSGLNLTPTNLKTYLIRTAGFRQFRLRTVATLGGVVTIKVTTHAGQFWNIVGGTVAHDQIDGGKPIKLGGYASGPAPSVVSADGDRANAWFDLRGALRTNGVGAQLIATGQVTPTGSATTIVAARSGRTIVTVVNGTNMTVYIGPATVTTANGFELRAGAGKSFPTTALLQCIVASATGLSGVLSYDEEYEA